MARHSGPACLSVSPFCDGMTASSPSIRRALLILPVAVLCLGTRAQADDPTGSDTDVAFFESRIRPVLVEHCYRCHDENAVEKDLLKGGLLVDSRDGMLKGGDSGPAIVPGNADESLLLEALRYESYEMPPGGKLSDEIIADFATWIARGAADPRRGDAPLPKRTIDLEAGREHWAYQPLTIPPSPPDARGATTSIDAFIDAKLADAGVAPVAQADRITLARRLTFDLTGLPPTPEAIDEFVADESTDAYEQFVDRLLASPRFGERWGRHWLDVARFAESVTLRGLVQHEAWRYRDYVIDAFNRDLPFNEFLREQIAGDLLPAANWEQAQRRHIATTFLTLTNANLEDQDKEKLRMDVVDEQLSVIGSAMLGQTIGCARCHDHKFDPIPQTDYYAMAGILRNTRTLKEANVSRWLDLPLPLSTKREAEIAENESQIEALKKQIAALKSQTAPKLKGSFPADSLSGIVLDDEQATLQGEWMRSSHSGRYVDVGYQHDQNTGRGDKSATFTTTVPADDVYEVRVSYTTGTNRSSVVHLTIVTADGEEPATINQREEPPIDGAFVSLGRFNFSAALPAKVVISNREANGHVIVDAIQFISAELADAEANKVTNADAANQSLAAIERTKQLSALQRELKVLEKSGPDRPLYQGVEEEADISDMALNIRGNVHNLGPVVPRGFLQVASRHAIEVPVDESGRRELGDWLADPENPLPARVYANRVWLWLFGQGLVRTPDNFGLTGEPPSHPQLLDYLAGRLIDQGWSTKTLIREIVLSDAYRRRSELIAESATLDPNNQLLGRMNRKRLQAECLLDAVLSVSDERIDQMGGKTFPDTLSADYTFEGTSTRRAVYWPLLRNAIPEILELFDGANPSLVTGKRNESSVAPQALYLMNNPWIIERSRSAADRLFHETLSNSERLERAFRLTLGRRPTDAEQQLVMIYIDEQTTTSSSHEEVLTCWSKVVQSLFCTLDFRFLN